MQLIILLFILIYPTNYLFKLIMNMFLLYLALVFLQFYLTDQLCIDTINPLLVLWYFFQLILQFFLRFSNALHLNSQIVIYLLKMLYLVLVFLTFLDCLCFGIIQCSYSILKRLCNRHNFITSYLCHLFIRLDLHVNRLYYIKSQYLWLLA